MINQRRFRGRHDSGARGRLLVAARACLRERGVAGTSSRLIAEAAGENLGAITYYFGSKDELVAAALADELAEWIQPALDALHAPVDAATRLVDAMGALNHAFETQRERVPALLDVFAQSARDRGSREPIGVIWNAVHAQLVEVIAELHAANLIASWVDPEGMAALIIAVVAGTVVHEAITPGGAQPSRIAAQFAGLLLSARGTTG